MTLFMVLSLNFISFLEDFFVCKNTPISVYKGLKPWARSKGDY